MPHGAGQLRLEPKTLGWLSRRRGSHWVRRRGGSTVCMKDQSIQRAIHDSMILHTVAYRIHGRRTLLAHRVGQPSCLAMRSPGRAQPILRCHGTRGTILQYYVLQLLKLAKGGVAEGSAYNACFHLYSSKLFDPIGLTALGPKSCDSKSCCIPWLHGHPIPRITNRKSQDPSRLLSPQKKTPKQPHQGENTQSSSLDAG